MTSLPKAVSAAWDNREGPIIFTTVNEQGMPNAIYATCVSKFNEDTLVVANNYFSKTLGNIQAGSKGTILFMTKDRKAYQIKGSLAYYEEGPIFDDMKCWNPEKHPGHGAVALSVEEVYTGAKKLT